MQILYLNYYDSMYLLLFVRVLEESFHLHMWFVYYVEQILFLSRYYSLENRNMKGTFENQNMH